MSAGCWLMWDRATNTQVCVTCPKPAKRVYWEAAVPLSTQEVYDQLQRGWYRIAMKTVNLYESFVEAPMLDYLLKRKPRAARKAAR